MRWIVLCLALAGCVPMSSYPEWEPPDKPEDRYLIRDLVDRTVKVDVQCSYGSGWGSGVHVGYTRDGVALIATAAHVANPECLQLVGGYYATTVARDDRADVAVLAVPIARKSMACWTHEYLGMGVIVTGYGSQLLTGEAALNVNRGYLASKPSPKYWRVTSEFWKGNSGGGVWDEEGCLVGLSVAVLTSGGLPIPGEFYLAPYPALRALLDSLYDAG